MIDLKKDFLVFVYSKFPVLTFVISLGFHEPPQRVQTISWRVLKFLWEIRGPLRGEYVWAFKKGKLQIRLIDRLFFMIRVGIDLKKRLYGLCLFQVLTFPMVLGSRQLPRWGQIFSWATSCICPYFYVRLVDN